METVQTVAGAVVSIVATTGGCQWRTSILPVTAAEIRVRVINAALLPSLLNAKPNQLTPPQIDLIARQLDARCRDVVY